MQNGPSVREVFFRPDDGDYLHSVLASREAMSAVPEIWRRYRAFPAPIDKSSRQTLPIWFPASSD